MTTKLTMKPIAGLLLSLFIIGGSFAETPVKPMDGSEKCGTNERLNQCSGCETTCAMLDRMCPMICNMVPKCECSSGFARNSENKCVPTAECTPTIRVPRENGTQVPPNKKCKVNEVLTSCPGCEPSCENRNPICTLACRLGQECQCKKGFFRNSKGKCVKAARCDRISQNPQSNSTCPKNEQYQECGGCEGSCTEHNPMCTLQCRPAGCYCPVENGFVRGPKGRCIHKSLCKKRAIGNNDNSSGEEQYNPCAATSCPVNTRCEVIQVQCVRAPCPPQARCVPLNETSNPCDTIDCPPNTQCKLNQVQCFTTPCPPIPECVPLNETRPSHSPPIITDNCALMFCAGTPCINGKCVPFPTGSTTEKPITDRCALMRCTANSTCIDGKCIPIVGPRPSRQTEPQDPCALILCAPNTRCERVQVNCIQAPCPPQGRCVPINETRTPVEEPPITCANIDCQSGQICKMEQVTCVRAPCHPVPTCVPATDDLQISDPCASMDCIVGFKCITVKSNCIREPCGVAPVEGRCVPINETEDIVRPSRSTEENILTRDPCATKKCAKGMVCSKVMVNCLRLTEGCVPHGICVPENSNGQPQLPQPSPIPLDDPCSIVKCSAGTKCTVVTPMCAEGATNCHARGVCVPTQPILPSPIVDPIPDDPCATVRCRAGTKCTAIYPSCLAGATNCGPRGVCIPNEDEQAE